MSDGTTVLKGSKFTLLVTTELEGGARWEVPGITETMEAERNVL